jgi:glycerophosphoryl diester phosphodiesterase
MSKPDWLIAAPIAHRGLHSAADGIVENTPSAVSAAVAAGYAIEVDLQITGNGEAMVHHDAVLGRVTEGDGRLAELQSADLKRTPFKMTLDRMLTLGDLLDLVAGRVALFLELKSRFDRDLRLARRVAEVVKTYAGPVAVMSFDPFQVRAMRNFAPDLPRGIVVERWHRAGKPAADEPEAENRDDRLGYLLHGALSRPHFVAHSVKDLPAPMPLFARRVLRLPLLAWTVRNEHDQRRARRFADQIIFEGFRP